MTPSDADNGTYLPTGWRVVGRGAERVAERAAAYAERLEPGRVADTLYAVQCTMEPAVRGRPAVERVLDAITEEIRKTWPDCPRLVRDQAVTHAPSRFGGIRFDAQAQPGKEWIGEIVWRAVHPVVAGAPITTWVLLEERASYMRLSVRVTADHGVPSVRGFVGAGQAQPSFLQTLRREVTLTWQGGPLTVHVIEDGTVADFVASVLESDARDTPVALLSPEESGEFIVDPNDLLWDLLGRAQLYVIREHRVTFQLSDAVGDKRMSCYWGAVRCFMPGWSRYDDPMEHPLLVADRLADPVMRATWLGEIGIFTGEALALPASLEERRSAAAAAAERAATEAARTTAAPAAAPAPVVVARAVAPDEPVPRADAPDLTPLLQTVLTEIRGLGTIVRQLNDEVERLRTMSSVRSSSTSAIERRLGRLEDILEQAFPDGSAASEAASESGQDDTRERASFDDEGGPALLDVVQDAAESYGDALVFLDSAFAAATDSPYEDPERVRAIMEAMARVARRRRDGELGTSLRDAFGDLGIDYRAAISKHTSARLREQYRFPYRDGQTVEAEEHIVLGNTYDPRRCLRVYFTSRVPNEPRFVIAHVGRHFEVKTSS